MSDDMNARHAARAAPVAVGQPQQQARRTRPALYLAVGISLVAALAIGVSGVMKYSGPPALAIATRAEDAVLYRTLAPDVARQELDDAQACRVPLAHVQMWHTSSMPDAVVRIKSGAYISPPFKLTATPERIAIPFPADYSIGKGTIEVVGDARGVRLSLYPTAGFPNVQGSAPINVVWTPGNACQ